MHTVNKRDVSLVEGGLVAEASTIGLGPGDWPDFIAVLDDGGQGFLFQRPSRIERDADGDVQAVVYHSRTSGAVLTVFND